MLLVALQGELCLLLLLLVLLRLCLCIFLVLLLAYLVLIRVAPGVLVALAVVNIAASLDKAVACELLLFLLRATVIAIVGH